MIEMNGTFNVLFVGQTEHVQVEIDGAVHDAYGHFLYLTGPNDVIYNWSNIVIMRRAK